MQGRRSAVCTHSSGTNWTARAYHSTVSQAHMLPRRLEPAQPEVFALTVRDLVSQDISIRSRKPMPRYYFHFRAGSFTLKDEVGEMLADGSSACSMPSGLPSNWCEATNRQMHRSS